MWIIFMWTKLGQEFEEAQIKSWRSKRFQRGLYRESYNQIIMKKYLVSNGVAPKTPLDFQLSTC